jgi:adenosylmethionine-8-amino-7-oxononanoate aminotransferase
LGKLLRKEFNQHPHVGGIRVQGLIGAIEIVREKARGIGFPAGEKMGERVATAAREAGLIVRPIGDIIAFSPPLMISDPQVEQLVERLRSAVHSVLGEG